MFAIPADLPSAPVGLSVSKYGTTSLKVTWSPTSNGGSPLLGYMLQYGSDTVVVGADMTQYILTGLTTGANYTVTLAAVNAAGLGAIAVHSPVAPGPRAPDAPASVRLYVESATSLKVMTDLPAANGGSRVTAAIVELNTDAQFAVGSAIVTTTSVSAGQRGSVATVVSGLTPGTVYYARARVVNAIGSSSWQASSPASAVPVGVSTTTVNIQQGRNGYSSTREVSISTQYIDTWNLMNGITYGQTATQYTYLNGAMTVQDRANEEFRSLLRFDSLGSIVPARFCCGDASLTPLSAWNPPFSVAIAT